MLGPEAMKKLVDKNMNASKLAKRDIFKIISSLLIRF